MSVSEHSSTTPSHGRRNVLKRILRKKRLPASNTSEQPLGILRVRVLAARDLEGMDRNGKSDPLVRLRSDNYKSESDTIWATLNPVWGSGGPDFPNDFAPAPDTKTSPKVCHLDVPIYQAQLHFQHVEVVLYDRDKLSRNDYLGEVALGIEDWFDPSLEPPVFYDDPQNVARWHPLVSTRQRPSHGQVLLKFGFLSATEASKVLQKQKPGGSVNPVVIPTTPPSVLSRIVCETIEDKLAGSRLPRSQRVRVAPPTESVGTLPSGQLPILARDELPGDSTSDSDFDESDTSSLSFAEEEDETEPTQEPVAAISSNLDNLRIITATPEPSEQDVQQAAALRDFTPSSFSSADSVDLMEDKLLTPKASRPSGAIPPSDTSRPSVTTSSLSSSGRKLGMGIPAFVKRAASSRSLLALGSSTTPSGAESDTEDVSNSGRKPFRRKASVPSDRDEGPSFAASSSTSDSGVPDKESKKKEKKKKARKEKYGAFRIGHGHHDIIGIVFLEIVKATGLPRRKAATRVTFDMDPFCIISFGQKVFRTRVIRHSLNPTWNERLFFHVREHETSFDMQFTIFDWDRYTSNDHVADARMRLDALLNTAPTPNEDGSFPCNSDGFLLHDRFIDLDLPLHVPSNSGDKGDSPMLKCRARFTPYAALRQQFWRQYLKQFDMDNNGQISRLELVAMLDSLGSTLSGATIDTFFQSLDKDLDGTLTFDEVVLNLETELQKVQHHRKPAAFPSGAVTPMVPLSEPMTAATSPGDDAMDFTGQVLQDRVDDAIPPTEQPVAKTEERVINIKTCPLCHKPRLNKRSEVDIITHLAVCASQDWSNLDSVMVSQFVTSQQAHRKWLGKFVSRVTKGAYQLGADSGNILVQDRMTGQLLEEKMQVYVRLGIRLGYRGMTSTVEGARVRRLFASMSVKQGVKFDSPESASQIPAFIAFHNLDMNEVKYPLDHFKTFNQFFYRELKPGMRPVADPDDPKTLVSCADCRMMAFPTVSDATRLWIKGKDFTISRLLGDVYGPRYAQDYEKGGTLAIFRLAPQDYHRYHAPVDGTIGKIEDAGAHYFTVNPMAIRSTVDVYGENKRQVIPIETKEFGRVFYVCIGAMMVASMVQTVSEGQHVKRGDEIGYFAFGGSTIICLFPPNSVTFDADILENSSHAIETLVRVGMRIGRAVVA